MNEQIVQNKITMLIPYDLYIKKYNYMISQTETTGGAGQYGFYAVPKPVQPKKKYRDNSDQQYEDEGQQDLNPYSLIEDKKPLNQKQLQRDFYVDQAPYPQFKPRQRGLDFGVQIERGDLFDFDIQVRPLVQILVGRSVVSAINELQEEKEKEDRSNILDKYQKKRNAQLMVTQRLEAKHKRKLEESQRRKLQKDLYIKNQKEIGRKIIARQNAKNSLLGFKNDLFNELDQAGYLRSEPTSDLKIKYEEWIYEKIMQSLLFQQKSERVAQNIIKEQEKQIKQEHRKAIQAQMNKRKQILDERARIQKENQQRKQKKRVKKHRQKMNREREPDFIKFEQLMERYQQVNSVLKFGDLSNGFSRQFASRQTVYIAGGLDNYLLALLQSSGKTFTSQQIETFIEKIISQSGKQFQVSLRGDNYDRIEEVRKKMLQNKGEFMSQKEGEIKDLIQIISLDISLLQAAQINLKSDLHKQFLKALLSIYLTVQPEKNQQHEGQLNDQQKKRLEFSQKIHLFKEQDNLLKRIQKSNQILRVHFEVVHSNTNSEPSELKEKQLEKQQEKEEWIDIYDGQGWEKYAKKGNKQLNRGEQSPASIGLGEFTNTFVIDERINFYLQRELQKLLELEGGEEMTRYLENVYNIRGRVSKDLAVYDSQIRW